MCAKGIALPVRVLASAGQMLALGTRVAGCTEFSGSPASRRRLQILPRPCSVQPYGTPSLRPRLDPPVGRSAGSLRDGGEVVGSLARPDRPSRGELGTYETQRRLLPPPSASPRGSGLGYGQGVERRRRLSNSRREGRTTIRRENEAPPPAESPNPVTITGPNWSDPCLVALAVRARPGRPVTGRSSPVPSSGLFCSRGPQVLARDALLVAMARANPPRAGLSISRFPAESRMLTHFRVCENLRGGVI